GADLEGLHRPLMRFPHPHALAAVQVPPAQPAVTASTDHHLPTRAPGYGRDRSRMPCQGSHALPAVHLPYEEFPIFSASTRGQLPPIRAPGHTYNDPMMSRQPQKPRAIGGVPHIHRAIIAPADQLGPIRAPGHTTDAGRLRISNPAAGACCHVPHLHSSQIPTTSQQTSVGTPGHALED